MRGIFSCHQLRDCSHHLSLLIFHPPSPLRPSMEASYPSFPMASTSFCHLQHSLHWRFEATVCNASLFVTTPSGPLPLTLRPTTPFTPGAYISTFVTGAQILRHSQCFHPMRHCQHFSATPIFSLSPRRLLPLRVSLSSQPPHRPQYTQNAIFLKLFSHAIKLFSMVFVRLRFWFSPPGIPPRPYIS